MYHAASVTASNRVSRAVGSTSVAARPVLVEVNGSPVPSLLSVSSLTAVLVVRVGWILLWS
jgi:hypothetical protein